MRRRNSLWARRPCRAAPSGAALGNVVNRIAILPLCIVAGPLFGQSNPDPATGVWYAKWGFALLPIALGLVFHLLTLVVAAAFIRDCVQKGRFRRMSGLPLVGPIFICVGLWWSPSQVPVWVFLLPWGIEFLAAIVSVVVQKATHARPV